MKHAISIAILLLFITARVWGQDINATPKTPPPAEKTDYTTEYVLFGGTAVLVTLWGIGGWGWGTTSLKSWHLENDGHGLGQGTYTGGADKMGHAFSMYGLGRTGTYFFEQSGDSRGWAVFKGFLFSQAVAVGIEIGDGFSNYGVSVGDLMWDLGGSVLSVILGLSPTLDNLIGFQLEYWPSRNHIKQPKGKWFEFTSDVDGQKFILALKLAGIPWIRDTFLQYFQIDFGYYTRGYWFKNSEYDYKTRHTYIGFAFNLSRASEKFLPEGSFNRASTTFFKYYHAPIAYNPDELDHTLGGKTQNTRN